MASLREILAYLGDLLQVERVSDYCPNGLQVEGKPEVRCLVSGVTACQALLEAAVVAGADALLVHHGYFWKGEAAPIVGMKCRRLKILLANDISLLAYHLPLDAHFELGNNAQLARVLNLEVKGQFIGAGGITIGMYGCLPAPMKGEAWARYIAERLGREPLYVPAHKGDIYTVGWCTGGAQGYIEQAAEKGLDAYLTGEVSEPTVHSAREQGIDFFACGHHATERYGVQALGQHLAEKFNLEHQFIDIDNPA
ncbi:Nif3-like dinuclear metal center hexameric protein [Nitrosococcus wardiae]|uniref:GTP cyclohydrolase 1 type 2 homolog n=1 Tax=Nitrosococcus wardiae TaxID=1814290 RepID=A0A4P7BW28_9GAMM|nr:Nif3-like dinuclear metal center hexameric protein [Nitrosococcus wardiae]QBQ54141.1 Nif3-like dinuclear metal center hexameric protein [Nitrosococcus wardiae]